MRRGSALRRAVAILAAAVAVAGCAAGASSRDTGAASPAADPGFGHVHGLSTNPSDGLLYVATHYGVWRVPTGGKPVRVADRYQDTMGFTVAGPDHFLASGHPDVREDLPAHLGLIESRDRAETWRPLSLLGEADFHALEAKHGRIYGYDSTSSTFMVSGDARTCLRLARIGMYDFTVAPTQPGVVLASTARGLVRSGDGGATFAAVPGAPKLVFVDWSVAGLYGVDAAGVVWASTDGTMWERRGELGSPPAR